MSRTDRRIIKSQAAIKKAFIELMGEKGFDQITIQNIAERADVGRRTLYDHYTDKFDLLHKLIEEHVNELREVCKETSEMNYTEGNLLFFEYFKTNAAFFSTMLNSKGAPVFRTQFLQFTIEELEGEIDVTTGKNKGMDREILLKFFASAIAGVVEAWIMNGLKESTETIATQIGILLDRNL